MGLHPSEILIGYEKGSKKCLELLDGMTCYTIENIKNKEDLTNCIRSTIASKLFGLENFISNLISEACL